MGAQGIPQYSQISTINMYEFIKIRYDILIECHGNYMEMKKVKLYIHFKKFLTKNVGVLRGNSPVNLGLDPKQIATESFSFAFITLKAHK